MILLDTNVLSEVIKPRPAQQVIAWLAAQEPLSIFTTSITQAEILYGVERMDEGKRKAGLSEAVARIFSDEFRGRILAFDEQTAPLYAQLVAGREASGRPVSQMDGMIAAVARLNRATLATHNVADFDGCGLRLIDPWRLSS